MPDSTFSDEDPIAFEPATTKAKRAFDAEKIRQDFIQSPRLSSGAPATAEPISATAEDER